MTNVCHVYISMQNKFGMDKIQGSHKWEWLYVLFPVRIYGTVITG